MLAQRRNIKIKYIVQYQKQLNHKCLKTKRPEKVMDLSKNQQKEHENVSKIAQNEGETSEMKFEITQKRFRSARRKAGSRE